METFRRIRRILSTIVVVIAIALAVALVGVRLLGFEVYTVLSGSMEPAYKTGSVIWVADREPEEIEVGDPITFVMNEDLDVATHRVIEIDTENQHFYTQGDANDAPDGSPVHFENLIGEPVFTVPYLGYLVNYVQSPPGCYIAVTVCALIVMLTFLPDLFSKDEEEDEVERKRQAAARDKRVQRAGAPGRHDVRSAQAMRTQNATPMRQQAPRIQPRALSGSGSQPAARTDGQVAHPARQANAADSRQRQPQPGQRAARPQAAVRPQHQQVQPRPQAQQRTQAQAGAARSNNPRLRTQSPASNR